MINNKGKDKPQEPWTGELPTPERITQANGSHHPEKTDEGRTRFRFTDNDILEHLQSRSIITGEQYACGKRFYNDWYQSGLAASGVVDPGRVVVDGGNAAPVQIRQMDAAHRWVKACKAVGVVLCHPLTDMVLLETTATVYALRYLRKRDPETARLTAYTLLGAALDALVLYYLGPRHSRSHYHRGERPEICRKQGRGLDTLG
jgi:hypothetical protein